MSERNAMQPMTMRHLANTQLALRELKHVQLLCDSYSKAQRSVFAAADPQDMPPVSAPLHTVHCLGAMLRPCRRGSIDCLGDNSYDLSTTQGIAFFLKALHCHHVSAVTLQRIIELKAS